MTRSAATPPTKARPRRYARAELPTAFGPFVLYVYRDEHQQESIALVRGQVRGAEAVLVRIHSECLTGEVLHSLKCDCRQQLDLALQRIAAAGRGALIYLRQEGRGIGLGNKVRAYALQQRGLDTVEANHALGFAADLRRYDVAAAILHDLGIRSVVLMSNNPDKLEALRRAGIAVRRRLDHSVPPNPYNWSYLHAKRERMGHWIRLPHQSPWHSQEPRDGEGDGSEQRGHSPSRAAVSAE